MATSRIKIRLRNLGMTSGYVASVETRIIIGLLFVENVEDPSRIN